VAIAGKLWSITVEDSALSAKKRKTIASHVNLAKKKVF
jgi:hypothetical protein